MIFSPGDIVEITEAMGVQTSWPGIPQPGDRGTVVAFSHSGICRGCCAMTHWWDLELYNELRATMCGNVLRKVPGDHEAASDWDWRTLTGPAERVAETA